MEENSKGKTPAIISYILLIGPLIAMSMNSGEDKTAFASFHIRQGLGLTITFVALGLLLSNFNIPMATMSIWIAVSILAMYGMFTAVKGETKSIPFLGDLFQKIFKNI